MTAEGDDLPDGSRVVRYVPYGRMEKDENDNFLRPYPSAFAARDGEEYLSATWCGYFEGTSDQLLRCAVEAIRGSMNIARKACFCVAETNGVLLAIHESGGNGRAIYHPEHENPAHAGIYGVDRENSLLLAQLANEIWCEFLTRETADALPLGTCAKSLDVR